MPAMARRLLEAAADTPDFAVAAGDSDMIVILAALLCALICVLGLGLVARCACYRRGAAAPDAATAAAKRGVKKEVLRALPTVSYVAGGDKAAAAAAEGAPECAICLAEFEHGEAMRVLPQCGHGFHAACVDTWLRAHSSCPSCRAVLVAALPPGERCRRFGPLPGGARRKEPCDGEGPTFLP